MVLNSLMTGNLTELNAEAVERSINANPAILWATGLLMAAMAVTILFLIFHRKGKEKGEEKSAMSKDAVSEIGTGIVNMVHIGKMHEQGARSGQQDCFGVSDLSLMRTHGLLGIVADGMGGLTDGDKVSAETVEIILDSFTMYQGKCSPHQQLLFLAKQAVEGVNHLLGESGFKKSGSTLVLGLVRDGAFSFLSVGDSRIYLYRNGILMQLNREHIFLNELALEAVNGEIPLQEVYTDSRRNGLISFLGMGRLEYLDMPAEPIRLIVGDKLLLMSDGVYNALDAQEITHCLNEGAEEAANLLRQCIQEKAFSNQDNYTAIIMECDSVPEGEEVAD